MHHPCSAPACNPGTASTHVCIGRAAKPSLLIFLLGVVLFQVSLNLIPRTGIRDWQLTFAGLKIHHRNSGFVHFQQADMFFFSLIWHCFPVNTDVKLFHALSVIAYSSVGYASFQKGSGKKNADNKTTSC